MKNQNPQEILNEILLRMKYDSSMTLSENKKIINEQTTYYYDSNGFLKTLNGPFAIPQGGVAAAKVYPNLKPGQYPNYNFSSAPSTKQQTYKDFIPRPQIPQSDVLGPQGSFPKSLGVDRESLEMKAKAKEQETQKKQNIELQKELDNKYEKELSSLKQKYGIGTKHQMISPQNFVPTNMDNYNEELSNYTTKYLNYQKEYNDYKENIKKIWPEYLKEKEILDKKYFKTKLVDFNEVGKKSVNLPQNTQISWIVKEDFRDAKTLRNTFFTNLTDEKLNRFTTNEPSGTYISSQGWKPTEGDLFKWIWNQSNGNVKSFILPEPYDKMTWKRRLYINNSGYFTLSDKYVTQDSSGNFIDYNPLNYKELSFWEEWGPLILNVASALIAILGKMNIFALLIGLGLDLYAAKMQSDQGLNVGAAFSVLLALTPFLNVASKVSKTTIQGLSTSFAGARTEADIIRIYSTLGKEEKAALDLLRRNNDLGKVGNFITNPNNSKKVIELLKQDGKILTNVLKSNAETYANISLIGTGWKPQQLEIESQKLDLTDYIISIHVKSAELYKDILNPPEYKKLEDNIQAMYKAKTEKKFNDLVAKAEENKKIIDENLHKQNVEKAKKLGILMDASTEFENKLKTQNSAEPNEQDKSKMKTVITTTLDNEKSEEGTSSPGVEGTSLPGVEGTSLPGEEKK